MNEEHLAILKKGVKEWNKWREEQKYLRPNLQEAILPSFDLSDFNLSWCNLNGALLNKANLRYANLTGALLFGAQMNEADLTDAKLYSGDLRNAYLNDAILRQAKLSEADLSHAKLRNARVENAILYAVNLYYSNFQDATLQGSNLRFANLTKTILRNTNLTDCVLDETIIGLNDLSNCKGLDTVKVKGPCVIDFETLRASKNIPEDFLFRIGLPRDYLNYLPALISQNPIQLSHSVFLSHSSEDREFADKLYKYLTSNGVRVWYDQRKIKPGDKIGKHVEKAINLYDRMIIVCSENSLMKTLWVKKELEEAYRKELKLLRKHKKKIETIIPIRIDDYVMDETKNEDFLRLRGYHIGDFTDWQNEESFKINVFLLMEALNKNREPFIEL